MLTFLALALYALVSAACVCAALQAGKASRPPQERATWHIGIALFAALAVMRALNVEEIMRQTVRQYARANSLYDDRWYVQAPIFILTFAGIVLLIWLFVRSVRVATISRRAFLARIAQVAMLAFVPLTVLRMISLHNFDRVLYYGPIKFNWVLELGLCGTIGVAAALYARRCIAGPPAVRRPGR